jgi:hypothetical protein
MFGRNKRRSDAKDDVAVDATLERDIERVEASTAEHLKSPSDMTRQSLFEALERLDDQTDRGDAYESSVIGSAAWGYASKGEVLGETSIDPVVDEIAGAELHAQVALVKAAKSEVRGRSPDTLAGLRSAFAALASIRSKGSAGQ